MGGFRLTGPNYIIHSIPSKLRCRCAGFRGTINEEVESILVNKTDKTLSFSDLPQTLQHDMLKYHLGDTMCYEVTQNKEKTKYNVQESNTYNDTRGWESMFAPLV
jgi:hypothetical protein